MLFGLSTVYSEGVLVIPYALWSVYCRYCWRQKHCHPIYSLVCQLQKNIGDKEYSHHFVCLLKKMLYTKSTVVPFPLCFIYYILCRRHGICLLITHFDQSFAYNVGNKLYICSLLSLISLLHIMLKQVIQLFFTFFNQSIAYNVGDKFYSCSLLSLISRLQIMLETSFTVVPYFL